MSATFLPNTPPFRGLASAHQEGRAVSDLLLTPHLCPHHAAKNNIVSEVNCVIVRRRG